MHPLTICMGFRIEGKLILKGKTQNVAFPRGQRGRPSPQGENGCQTPTTAFLWYTFSPILSYLILDIPPCSTNTMGGAWMSLRCAAPPSLHIRDTIVLSCIIAFFASFFLPPSLTSSRSFHAGDLFSSAGRNSSAAAVTHYPSHLPCTRRHLHPIWRSA